MLHTLETGSVIDAANLLPYKSLGSLSETARKLFLALWMVAEEVKKARGYSPATSQVTFFCPLEAVALAIGVARQTVYNHLPTLVEMGLVAQRAHYCTYRGSTKSDGSLWAVRLDPSTPGQAKLEHDWLCKQGYRDLGQDIEAGRTAWKLLQSNPNKEKQLRVDYILAFALPPTSQDFITSDCQRNEVMGLEAPLDLPYVPLEARNESVNRTARAVSSSLGSPQGSLMFYRWLLWNLLRLEQQNKSYFYQVFLILQRAKVAKEEGAAKNAGGLAVSWLKQSPIWDELRSARQVRIGRKPRDLS